MSELMQWVFAASLVGLAGGLGLLYRGLGSYRRSGRISDTATSRISSLAVGEALVTGIVEPAELVLVSPLQSRPCVYYRARVQERQERSERTVLREERGVGFRVRDETGTIRVFPRGARWAIADQFNEHTSMLGDEPAGLDLRVGPSMAPGSMDRDAAIERLLAVRDQRSSDPGISALTGPGHRSYREARLEPGDVVTVVGFAQPFDQLPDPASADDAGDADAGDPLSDPAIAADLEAARASGELADSPEEARGNAGIPGFGIGRPVRQPLLDAEATPLPIADGPTAERFQRTFEIEPEDLVIAATQEVPLLVAMGPARQAAARENSRFVLGLVGAVIAIASVVALAVAVTGVVAG